MRGLVLKITVAWALAFGCFASVSCGNDGPGDADGGGGAAGSGTITDAGGDPGQIGCLADAAVTACPTPPVTYGNVKPIFQARCVSVCHNGVSIDPVADAAIWKLDNYKDLVDWLDTIRSSVGECSMPPSDAGVPVTLEERRTILEWIRCGHPQ